MPYKETIDVTDLESITLDSRTLAEACKDYLFIENNTQDTSTNRHYNNHYQQRLRTGESIFIRVTNVEVQASPDRSGEGNPELEITADLPYTGLDFDDPERIKRAIRKKGESSTSMGSFMIATPISRRGEQEYVAHYEIRNCPSVTIKSLDLDKGDHGEIVLSAINSFKYGQERPFRDWHKDFITNPPEDETREMQVSEGDLFILDPGSDDYTGSRARVALEYAERNAVYNLLESFIAQNAVNESTAFDRDRIETFVEWLQSQAVNADLPPPNPEQETFITDVTHELSLLQGPPGTGKTSGAIAPAIVGRLLAHDESGPCRTLVTGASNKAIDEVLADVAELVQTYQADPSTGNELDDVLLYRATDSPGDSTDQIDTVVYKSPHEFDREHSLRRKLHTRLVSKPASEPLQHVVCFATPGRAWTLGGKLFPDDGEDDTIENIMTNTGLNSRDSNLRQKFFDVLVADEASMMNVPQLLLAGAFYRDHGNILIAGDHRQLPPVQEHEWDKEYRPTIRSVAPHSSVLNFFRLLRGEEIAELSDELHDLLTLPSNGVNSDLIPMHQLETTYRCHTVLAELLRKWVYALDDLNYQSDLEWTITPPSPGTDAVDAALDPEQPVTVITYDDESSQQANELEALLSQVLIKHADGNNTAGVVTPHNAQRGILEQRMKASATITASEIDIDTVERFQGGERDMMIVNGTVSDPDYIASESEFLLNLNRLNVSMSRMKKKLIVVASQSVFDHIPLDVEEYDQARLWKGLAEESGLADDAVDPVWSGSVDAFTGQSVQQSLDIDDDTTIDIYHLSSN